MWIFTRDFSSPSTSKVEKKKNVWITFFLIRNDFAPKRLSVPRLESKPAPEQTLQKWRLPSKKSKTDPVQALQCNAWEPRQAQNSDPTQEERSLKESMLWQWIPTNHFYPSFVPFIKVELYSRKSWRVISFFGRFCDVPTEAESNILRLTGGPGELLGHVCDNQGKVLFNVLRLVTNKINKIHSLNSLRADKQDPFT